MLGALLHDGLRADDLEFTLLLDGAVDVPFTSGIGHSRVTVIRVPDGEERRSLAEAATGADWTVVVAPETNGIHWPRLARAVLDGRLSPSLDDVAALAAPILRHRMALSFAARADGISLDGIVAKLCEGLG
jgi:hypothetical protein